MSRVSILLLAYNQASLVQAAVSSVLAQVGEPLEIILSDDASSDGTYETMCETANRYTGPHRVILRRNDINMGIGAHLNTLVACSQGDLLVIAAGDDISEPNRVRELHDAWLATDFKADLLASNLIDLDEQGTLVRTIRVDDLALWTRPEQWVARRPHVIGAAHAWTRRVFEQYGPLDAEIAYEDQVMVFRALASGGAVTVPQALVQYRRGGTSARGPSQRGAEKLRRIEVQNRRHLAELRQLQVDAPLGNWSCVAHALISEQAKQQYLHDLLTAPGVAGPLHQFIKASALPWAWRWRKFWTVANTRLRAGRTSTRS